MRFDGKMRDDKIQVGDQQRSNGSQSWEGVGVELEGLDGQKVGIGIGIEIENENENEIDRRLD